MTGRLSVAGSVIGSIKPTSCSPSWAFVSWRIVHATKESHSPGRSQLETGEDEIALMNTAASCMKGLCGVMVTSLRAQDDGRDNTCYRVVPGAQVDDRTGTGTGKKWSRGGAGDIPAAAGCA